ncbi:MAG TPA: hypothetical protein DER05_02900 [Lutibacter sp.]|nr:hypothetical protein [Lutibacter sp.]
MVFDGIKKPYKHSVYRVLSLFVIVFAERLTSDLLKVVKTDAINERGMRTIEDGSMGLISGFDFNTNGKLGSTLFAAYSNNFDRVTGEATVNIPSFSPSVRIAAPAGTTHFKLVTGASELDFVNETSTFENDETAILPYDSADTGIANSSDIDHPISI